MPKTLEQLLDDMLLDDMLLDDMLLDDISNLVIEGLLSQEKALLLITEINAKRRASRLAKLEQERGRGEG